VPSDSRTVLTLCGSLAQRSANRAALVVVSATLADLGAIVHEFDDLPRLPAFEPSRGPDQVVDRWCTCVSEADAVVIAAPEYAGGLAGSTKNALDWLVGGGELYGKPVGVISAGTSGGEHARVMLMQTLTWQGAHVVADLGIAGPLTKVDTNGAFVGATTIDALRWFAQQMYDAVDDTDEARYQRVTTVLSRVPHLLERIVPPGR
jgi:chromate reductase, NAD(P)H dehydrogenase (quinone)